MPRSKRYSFTPASNPVLRWLTDPGRQVPNQIRDALLGELFTSPNAVVAGMVNGLILNSAALIMTGGRVFVCLLIFDVGLASLRMLVVRRAARAAFNGLPAPTDLAVFTMILWCGLQGTMAGLGAMSGVAPLQVLSGVSAMAILGPICARNYPAPRLAILLISLVQMPFVAGALLSGERWFLILLAQSALYYYGSLTIMLRFHRIAIASLLAQHRSHQLALHDPLTGLLNRTGLMEELAALQAAAARDAGAASFILFYLDLDGFKLVNDARGHEAGDRLLTEVAHRLRACTRSRDILARLGGDEFVIVARSLPPNEAAAFAETIIRRVTDHDYGADPQAPARISISIGFACCPEDGTSLDDLQRRADAALYESKRAGKGTYRRHATDSRASDAAIGAGPLAPSAA